MHGVTGVGECDMCMWLYMCLRTYIYMYSETYYAHKSSPFIYLCAIHHVHVPVGPNVEAVSSSLVALPLLGDGVQIHVMFEV